MSQKSLSTVGLGLLMLIAPFTLGDIRYFSFPFLAQIALVSYSILVIIGGILEAGAKRYKFLIDGYTLLGVILFVLGAPTGFALGETFWITMTFLIGFFWGLPSVILLKINR